MLRLATFLSLLLLLPHPTVAAVSDAQKCSAAKQKAAGKYTLCRMAAVSRFAKKPDAAKRALLEAKCLEKLGKSFDKADDRWGVECQTSDDVGIVDFCVSEVASELETYLTDGSVVPSCGAGGGSGAVRFVVLGDTGEGSAVQFAVSQAMESVCDSRGCDFGLLLGDLIYPSGPQSPFDSQFQIAIGGPYANLDFPLHAVLGTADYGASVCPLSLNRPDYYKAFAASSTQFSFPSVQYDFAIQNALFVAVDTPQILCGTDPLQAQTVGDTLDTSTLGWKIAFGHHPYLSNGELGNAGNYNPNSAFGDGAQVQALIEDHVCGEADVYFSAGDHTLQWMEPTCGTEFIVSGTGSKSGQIVSATNPSFFGSNQNGFVWVELAGNVFTGAFYDSAGNLLFERSFTRAP